MTGSFRRRGDVLWRRCGDAVVVLPLHSSEAFTIGGTGSALWDLLDESQTYAELVDAVSVRFARPARSINRSLRPALDELVSRGAVEAVDPGRRGRQ